MSTHAEFGFERSHRVQAGLGFELNPFACIHHSDLSLSQHLLDQVLLKCAYCKPELQVEFACNRETCIRDEAPA